MLGSTQSASGKRMPIALKRVLRLEQCGLSAAAFSRWAASGRLQRIYPSVYVVGHRVLCTEGRLLAAILYAGPGAALSHVSAASWWDLVPYLPDTVHVSSLTGAGRLGAFASI